MIKYSLIFTSLLSFMFCNAQYNRSSYGTCCELQISPFRLIRDFENGRVAFWGDTMPDTTEWLLINITL